MAVSTRRYLVIRGFAACLSIGGLFMTGRAAAVAAETGAAPPAGFAKGRKKVQSLAENKKVARQA